MESNQRVSDRPSRCWAALLALLAWVACAAAGDTPPLERVQVIPLKGPAGRLDHLALDAEHGRLFVANMANASLDVVDLKAGRRVAQVPGQKKIQGIAYAPDLDRIFVGNGADGVCNVLDGHDYKPIKAIPLEDADNVRYDPRTRRVYVGHADKALAVIDARTLEVVHDVKLPGPPEAFQLARSAPRLYLNTPEPAQVVVVDTAKAEVVARYPLRRAAANFPLALDEAGGRIFVGCRREPMVVVLDSATGKELAAVPIAGDPDDLFHDAKRSRLYASCGEGYLAVVRHRGGDRYELEAKLPTAKLARTSLFDAASGRLYLVVPRGEGRDGPEVWVYEARP
jgi:DNA-binding beta-propeller fold protein YncE